MKKVLVYYRYFGATLGGGEYLPLSMIAELQTRCEVTLALDWTDHFERAVELMGVPLDLARLKVVQAMPRGFHGTTNGVWLSYRRFRRLKALAADADACISLANIMDFGRPAHHFLITLDVGDPAFDDYVAAGAVRRPPRMSRRIRSVADAILRPMLGMRTKRRIITDPRERIYPNSHYVARLLEGFYGGFHGSVFHPPTLFLPDAAPPGREPLKVVYLGRVSPAKRILDIVEIVRMARAFSGAELELHLAGHLPAGPFRDRLQGLADGNPWLRLCGEVYGADKSRFLLSGSFAIHAMRKEAFGISVTEYLKAGIVPVVPDEGGSCEVVDNPALSYRTLEEAARILARLATDVSFRESARHACAARAEAFSPQAYRDAQSRLLESILAES